VERDNIRVKVMAVNPSGTKTQNVPVKIYLPQEIRPEDILSKGELEVGYDNDRGVFYVFKNGVSLKPKETRVFEVEVKDVWYITQEKLGSLKDGTTLIVSRLENTPYYEQAQKIVLPIFKGLDTIDKSQNDDTVGRKERIGIYRTNLKLLDSVEKDFTKLQSLFAVAQALPVPEVLEKPKVKTESPTKTTTWMIIFIIILFIGMLAGVFFFTWHTQARFTKDFIGGVRRIVFGKGGTYPGEGGSEGGTSEEEPKKE